MYWHQQAEAEEEWCGFTEVYARRSRRRLTYTDSMTLYSRPSQHHASPRLVFRNVTWPLHVERFAAEVGVTWIVSVCKGNAPHRLSVCRALSKALRTAPEDVIDRCPWLLCPPEQWQPTRSLTQLAPDPLLSAQEIAAGLHIPSPENTPEHKTSIRTIKPHTTDSTESKEEPSSTESTQDHPKIHRHTTGDEQVDSIVLPPFSTNHLVSHSLLDAVGIAAPSSIWINHDFDDPSEAELSSEALDALADLI